MSIYRGVSGVNRKVTDIYRGVNGVNREVQEQYRGVSGVNRLVYQNLKPYTLINLVTDPSFESKNKALHSCWTDGPEFITNNPSIPAQHEQTCLSMRMRNSSTSSFYYNNNTPFGGYVLSNHKYYMSIMYTSNSSEIAQVKCALCICRGATWENANYLSTSPIYLARTSLQWDKISGIYSTQLNTTRDAGFSVLFPSDTASPNAGIFLDSCMAIDLTACFGAGNEPDKAWCDDNIPFFIGNTTVLKKPVI